MLPSSLRIRILLENRNKGYIGEKIAKADYIENGFRIISTRIGSDFIAFKKIDGVLYQEYVEVKTGRSKQSVVQKKKMREIKRRKLNYTVYRISEKFLLHSILSKMRNTEPYDGISTTGLSKPTLFSEHNLERDLYRMVKR